MIKKKLKIRYSKVNIKELKIEIRFNLKESKFLSKQKDKTLNLRLKVISNKNIKKIKAIKKEIDKLKRDLWNYQVGKEQDDIGDIPDNAILY